MHEHGDFAQQINGEVLVRLQRGHPQHSIPATIDAQTLACFLMTQLAIQFPHIAPYAIQQQRLNMLTLVEQRGVASCRGAFMER